MTSGGIVYDYDECQSRREELRDEDGGLLALVGAETKASAGEHGCGNRKRHNR